MKQVLIGIAILALVLWPILSLSGSAYDEGYEEGYCAGCEDTAQEEYDRGYEEGFQEAQRIIFDSMTQQEFNSWWRRNQRIIQKYGMYT